MMTAAQAREKTLEKINQIANEFIINTVATCIQEAINNGWFHTTVCCDGVFSQKVTTVAVAAEVVRLLEANGYKAEYVNNREASYISVDWEEM